MTGEWTVHLGVMESEEEGGTDPYRERRVTQDPLKVRSRVQKLELNKKIFPIVNTTFHQQHNFPYIIILQLAFMCT